MLGFPPKTEAEEKAWERFNNRLLEGIKIYRNSVREKMRDEIIARIQKAQFEGDPRALCIEIVRETESEGRNKNE